MWTFRIGEGKIFHDAVYIGAAYSGAPGYIDNPADESLSNRGPLPEGWYTIGAPIDSPKTGEYSLSLTPDATNDEYGRGGFYWHGDAIHAPGTASHGCVVSILAIRQMAWESGDHRLQVTA